MENFENQKNLAASQSASQLQFRCPQCKKLFQADPRHIHSSEPEFECSKCFCRFSFSYPPAEGLGIQVKTLTLPQVKKMNSSRLQATGSGEVVPCPKCQAKNPRTAKECFKCGVIFARYQKNMPSLMRAWQEVLNDYNAIARHTEFIERCEKANSLSFAMKKYQTLKEAQPQDPIAQQMLNSLLLKTFSSSVKKSGFQWVAEYLREKMGAERVASIEQSLQDIPWANIGRVAPVALGSLMLFLGLVSSTYRNLLGAGVALLVLSLGFTYFFKGRIHWSDFWH